MVRMKALILAGIVVAALGVVVLTRGISYPSHHSSMHIGDLVASVQEEHAIPSWVGIVAVAAGALIIGAGLRRRKA
jgi:drug/metabolite transporter (DMT)-like permease